MCPGKYAHITKVCSCISAAWFVTTKTKTGN